MKIKKTFPLHPCPYRRGYIFSVERRLHGELKINNYKPESPANLLYYIGRQHGAKYVAMQQLIMGDKYGK